MTIDLYAIGWNEMRMLGFFFRHYEPLVDRFIMFDDGSTDGTLEYLRSKPNVELRPFPYGDPNSFVASEKLLHDQCWKESRGSADWVIVTDIDEHLYHPDLLGYLDSCKRQGVTYIPALGFEMVSDTFPESEEHLISTRSVGAAFADYSKLRIFDPNAIDEVRFGLGGHVANPSGKLMLPETDELLLFHYKYIGSDYVFTRQAALGSKLKSMDVENRWGIQYLYDSEEHQRRMRAIAARAVNITAPQYHGRHHLLHRGPRWWRPAIRPT